MRWIADGLFMSWNAALDWLSSAYPEHEVKIGRLGVVNSSRVDDGSGGYCQLGRMKRDG
jgi:hypothetical protein